MEIKTENDKAKTLYWILFLPHKSITKRILKSTYGMDTCKLNPQRDVPLPLCEGKNVPKRGSQNN